MATSDDGSIVRLIYTFPDGDKLDVIVRAASSYPDALSQASAEAQRNLREGVRLLIDEFAKLDKPAGDDDG